MNCISVNEILNETKIIKFDVLDVIYILFIVEFKKSSKYIFANMLSEFYSPNCEKIIPKEFVIDKKNNIYHKFLSLKSNTFLSSSEYNWDLIPATNIDKFNTEYSEIIDIIEKETIHDLIYKNEITIITKIILPTQQLKNKIDQVNESIIRLGFQKKIFNMMLFEYVYNELHPTLEKQFIHKNSDLNNVINKNLSKVLYYLKDKSKEYNDMHLLCTYFGEKKTQYGYKLIPLSLNAIENPFDINDIIWREYLISLKVSDLMINKVSSGFPIFCDWFFIRDIKRESITNTNILSMLENEKELREIQEYINRSKIKVGKYLVEPNLKIQKKISNIKNLLGESLNIVKNNFILSEGILMLVHQYVGYPITNYFTNIQTMKIIGNPFADENYELFIKYMFEIIYNILSLHIKLGIIHGDTHLNNITINFNECTNNKHVYYKIKDRTYMFNNSSYNIFVIDYGKSIINPDNSELFNVDNELEDFNQIYDNIDGLINENQYKSSIIELYDKLFPTLSEQLRIKMETNLMFKKLTSIDFFIFITHLKKIIIDNKIKIGWRQKKLISKIKSISANYLDKDLFNDKDIIDYPGEKIINECFNEYIVIKNFPSETDYNIDNKITKSTYKSNKDDSYIKHIKSLRKNNMFVVLNIIPKRHYEKYL